jgi:type II secretory pathway pseudopilin PulG
MSGNFFGSFKKRDIIVVLVAIIALAGLFVVIRMTRQQDRIAQKELVENSTEETSQEAVEKSSTVSYSEKVIVNEISNDGVIEFYNTGSRAVVIGGYKIFVGTDLAATVEDGASLDGKGYYTVETKKSFTKTDKNIIRVFDAKDKLVKAVSFDAIPTGYSYGCVSDASFEAGITTSSIGESNNKSERMAEEGLAFSVPGGFYEEAFELEVNVPEGCKVYYTLDGTEPTTESMEYTSKINIARPSGTSYTYAVSDGKGYTYSTYSPSSVDMGTIVNAIAVDAKGKTVDCKKTAYYIGYNTDSDYIGLPVISLEVDPDEMFGFVNGIYVPGKNYYDGYIQGDTYRGNFLRKNAAAHGQMEYYEESKDRTFAAGVSVSIYNDARRHADQKSLVVETTGEYPNGTSLDGFCNEGYKSFLLLSGGWDNYTKARNYVVNDLAEGTNLITRDYSPCIVFINGEYWGLYTMANDYNPDYFRSKYNIKDKMITVTSDYVTSVAYQTFYDYVISTDFSIQANYEIVKTMMDVSNYIEFMCANVLIGNTRMNMNCSACAFRTVENTGTGYSDGKWRWAINNVECTMGNPYSFIDPYTRGNYSTSIMNTYLSPGIRDNAFFNSLLQNDSFAKEYMKTMNNLMDNYFTSERASKSVDATKNRLYKAATETNKRYSAVDSKQVDVELERIKNFFEKREYYLRVYTDEYISNKGDVPGIIRGNEEESEEGSTDESGAIIGASTEVSAEGASTGTGEVAN